MIDVRPATSSDAPLIIQAQLSMAKESEGLDLDKATVSAGVQAVFEDPKKGSYFVAEVAGTVVGCLLTVPEWSDWRNSTVLWIHSVYTWPAYRKKGVYKALYTHLQAMVENDTAYAGLRLYVEQENTSAQEVYKKLGMNAEHYDLYEWLKS